ncbi:hypothetical protein OLX02_01905 [Novosphingobium sp. KCTC 2891]|uniref:hypothetical protein n=1 Tax=Novosphingobium sp. KCTC 2891 TaxID=2989730 RepID=UPI002223C3BD|nr:hypothetical protein [Novosphingobium sp. KCTC 2891]MCW1381568.1 hypothetical protein [Novosphingobium sp. KCTC 2891]
MLRFAPAYGIVSPCLVRPATGWLLPRAANDNTRAVMPLIDNAPAGDALLGAALRLFAAHGLSAAARACEEAADAERRGDSTLAAWWIEVCRTLDRGMAREFSRRRAHRR